MKSPSFSAEQIARSAVSAYERSLANPIPEQAEPGYRVSSEWGEIWGLGKARTRDLIAGHVKAGRMVKKSFRVEREGNGCHPTPHYKAVTAAK